jgi:hypothetical protein
MHAVSNTYNLTSTSYYLQCNGLPSVVPDLASKTNIGTSQGLCIVSSAHYGKQNHLEVFRLGGGDTRHSLLLM